MRREADELTDKKLQSYVDISQLKSFFLLAGAGAGKTRSLVKTLQGIQRKHGNHLKFEGKKVAVVTYTKAASEEINRRLNHDALFHVSTIHSFSWELIRHFQKDIKKYLLNNAQSELNILNNKIRERRNQEPTKTQSNKVDKLEKNIKAWEKVMKFNYSPDSNNLKQGYLNHSQVIDVLREFLESKALFQKIFVNKYPVLFIDECQDTNRGLMDAFLLMEQQQEIFCLGLFGDMMQQIYNDGKADLKEAISEWENQPEKEMNWRSQKRIVEFINEIRKSEDGLKQYHDKEKIKGILKVYIRSSSIENLEQEEKKIKENFEQEITIRDKEIHSLILEHRMAARRNGYIDLYDTLNSASTRTILADASGSELKFIREIIFCLYNIYRSQNKFDLLKMVREKRLLENKELDWNSLGEISRKLTQYMFLFKDIEITSMGKYISELNKLQLFEIPDVFIIEDEESEKWDNWNNALKFTYKEFESYFNYTDKMDGYITQQGSKGLEYNNVMVIINDDEKKGNLFSYEKMFGVDALSVVDENNIRDNKDNALARTRRLFYVSASRAKESLAIVIYTKDVNKAKDFFVEHSLATKEEIDMGEQII